MVKKKTKKIVKVVKKLERAQNKIPAAAKKIPAEPASLVISSLIHRVECMRCGAITPIQKLAHNPTARFACIQCNAQLDVFNNCKTCNE